MKQVFLLTNKLIYHVRMFPSRMQETISLSLPLIIFQLTTTLTDYILAAFISNLGSEYAASFSIINSIIMIINILIFGIVSIVGIDYSRSCGSNKPLNKDKILGHGLYLGMFLCIIIIVTYLTLPSLLHQVILIESYNNSIKRYFYIQTLSVVPYCFSAILIQLLISEKNTIILMNLNILRLLALSLLAYLLIYGAFGFLGYGFIGAAYASAIVTWLYFIILIGCSYKVINLSGLIRLNFFSIKKSLFYIYNGILISSALVIEVSSHLVFTIIAGLKGNDICSIYLFFMQTEIIFIIVPFAISRSITAAVSYAIGKNNKKEIPSILYKNLLILIVYQIFITIILLLFSHSIINSFFGSQDFIIRYNHLLQEIIHIIIFMVLTESIRMVLIGYFCAIKDLVYLPLINFISFIGIGSVAGAFLLLHKNMHAMGLILGLLIGSVCSMLFLYWRYSYCQLKYYEVTYDE